MSDKIKTEADVIMHGMRADMAAINPQDGSSPKFADLYSLVVAQGKMMGRLFDMVEFLFTKARNGGMPSRPAGKIHKLPIIGEVGGERLGQWAWRAIIIGMMLMILVRQGAEIKLEHGENKMTITPRAETAYHERVQE